MSVVFPSDEELRIRLQNPEDHFVERKTAGDAKDWLKTAVAFANSAPIGFPCVLFLNVRNDGSPEPLPSNSSFEKLQQSFGEKISVAHPPIPNFPGSRIAWLAL